MTEKKKHYLSPRMKVGQVPQIQIICASTRSMYEEDLDSDYFEEE